MDTHPRPLLALGTLVRVLTHRDRDRIGEVVAGPTDGAWDDLMVWVDLGRTHPVPVLPHEICPVEDHAPAQQAADAAPDPVAAALESLRTSWPYGPDHQLP